MQKNEFLNLAAAIKTYYPKDNILPTKESMELWYDLLSDLDYKMAQNAMKNYVKKNQYPPTIADLRQEYELLDDERRRKRAQLKETYNSTLAIYPCAYDERPGIEKVYKSILMEFPEDERPAVANKIYQRVDDFVRAWEKKNDPNIITLTEYLKSGDWR